MTGRGSCSRARWARDCRGRGHRTRPRARRLASSSFAGLHDSRESADSLAEDVANVRPGGSRDAGGALERRPRPVPHERASPNLIRPHGAGPPVRFRSWPRLRVERRWFVVHHRRLEPGRPRHPWHGYKDFGTGVARGWRILDDGRPGPAVPADVFFFPGIIAIDPPTPHVLGQRGARFVAWGGHPAGRPHKRQMDRYRATGNADRASFTRLTALRGNGTWYGRDPVVPGGEPTGPAGPGS